MRLSDYKIHASFNFGFYWKNTSLKKLKKIHCRKFALRFEAYEDVDISTVFRDFGTHGVECHFGHFRQECGSTSFEFIFIVC
ncbi:hypothetical protein ABE28_001715 [Peribacillus muralis]|uniref:Uncharacterized protein n=1 Tax=Peribacillus muralis TaxID=264697 RepID=A0A1B3XIN6_9BACI|nr:hypothetical protein ABE28_001715 [Peribacillus muralis]